ncbi:nitronate monooxygenase family protein [uncultured Phenylobacterium sp.]|uniref:NAD(P)H-dependent flavin oxidoreductase n=1 Tax=uncultured Phenylobacterium sp. TaxID=349273 RepID=UPI0025FFBB50|nr:nitronate monooxygenase [uncultured Phenylobacterium sp.]
MHSFEGNRVTRHTGTEFPVFQAPIGLISRGALVGAVSAAGGVGLLETGSLPIPQLQAEFDIVRDRSNRPFGLHFLIAALERRPEQEKAALDWALDGRTKLITTGYGDPTRYIKRIKDAGAVTYHLTETLEEALRAEDAGVDGVVLGGAEKGGGNGADNLHTFALLQQARKRLSIPIVATGGIVDGYGMAAAFALGAEGVWMGTRFIASEECPWHDNYKQAIVEADEVISIDIGSRLIPKMRAVRNTFSEAVARGEAGDKSNPYAGDAMKLFYEGRTDLALVGCGESAVLIDKVKPAGDIVRDTVAEFWGEIDRLSSLRGVASRPLTPAAEA